MTMTKVKLPESLRIQWAERKAAREKFKFDAINSNKTIIIL